LLLIFFFFFFNDTATTEIYTLSLHDALPISPLSGRSPAHASRGPLRHTLERSEEHTSELQSRETISYAVFCLKKKKRNSAQTDAVTKPTIVEITWYE